MKNNETCYEPRRKLTTHFENKRGIHLVMCVPDVVVVVVVVVVVSRNGLLSAATIPLDQTYTFT
ncbi:hypothetical protein E2C01_086976 [Portunus trituberculatus]|uniref:Transmembrane protein n=1 Tax=Portunus trituberculatus TaxID=210409 RepID=A0A5B7JC31_PORTR|nr:hypothetical protein [Portunus trituberculatus]